MKNYIKLNFQEIKPSFDNISNSIRRNITVKYLNNENNLRIYYKEESTIKKEIENYSRNLNSYNNGTINIIKKENISLEINEKLIDDYYNIFLNKNLYRKKKKENEIWYNFNEDNIKLLKLMINLRNNSQDAIKYLLGNKENNNIVNNFAENINWIESYSEEIILIEKIFTKLNAYISELYKKIDEIINNKIIKYQVSDNKYNYFLIINEVFFIFINTLIRTIYLSPKNELNNSENNLSDFISDIKIIYEKILQLENDLNLYSEEIINLKQIINLTELFSKITFENFIKITNFFDKQNELINNSKNANIFLLSEELDNFYVNLIEILKKDNKDIDNNKENNIYKIISHVLYIEYEKIKNDNYREKIVDIILNNNSLIRNSSQIFKTIVDKLINKNNEEEIINILDRIKEEKSSLFQKINNFKNEILDEIIMNIFEGKIIIYYEFDFLDNSLKLLEHCIQLLDNLSGLKESKDNYKEMLNKKNLHLCELFAVVYVKIYLDKFILYIKDNDNNEYKEFFIIIKNIKNNKFKKVIKIYIFKLLYYYTNHSFEELKNFNYRYNFEIQNDFPLFYDNKEEIAQKYFLFPLEKDDYIKYLEILNQFENIKKNNYNCINNQEIININNIDIFLTISINKIFLNLSLPNYFSFIEEHKKFCDYFKPLLENNNNYKNNKQLLNLLYLFYDSDTYKEKIFYDLINQNSLELIIYGFRYCVNSLSSINDDNKNSKKSLYQSFLYEESIEEVLNQSLIPGIDAIEDLHLTTLETIITHLNTKNERHGCYVCSCGYYYDIDPCGFPTKNRTFDCPVCGMKIGWGPKKVKVGESTHGMVIRPGHYRVFKNEQQKKSQMKVFDEVDENIPNILLPNYINEVIEPIRKKSFFGFNSISKDYFLNKNKRIRNLSCIGYRLLNYISYCHLFFSYCLGCISEENMKKCLVINMNILQIIEGDWNLLKESLEMNNITSVEIFMNMIFKKLSMLIKECKYLYTEEEREKFENDVEKLIDECIKNYPSHSNRYIEENNKQAKFEDYYNIETIIAEVVPPNKEEIYTHEEYPFFKYFRLTKYKTKEDFINHLNINVEENEKYPLINQLLSKEENYSKMKYLPKFNEFINYIVEKYSFTISRDESKNRILNKEDIFKNPDFIKKFGGFLEIWKIIKNSATKYKCYPEMQIKELDSEDKLSFFLNDNGELNNGMYLAAACQNFIDWQNSFLMPIVESNSKILHRYCNKINKKIPLNESNSSQILSIEDNFKKSKYKNLYDIIYTFSERKIFVDDTKINYFNYNSFVYDYDLIEEELGKIILPNVHLFEGEEQLNFVIFWSESFKGERSQIISKLFMIYPQKDLDEDEKNIIISYIKSKNNYDFKYFLSSMQMIIYYLAEKVIFKGNEKMNNIMKNIKSSYTLTNDCINFFLNEGKELTVDKIMNIYAYFEHLCYNDLINNLQDDYKKEIDSEIKNNIINNLINNENKINIFNAFSRKDLASALRRFISRYLVGKRQNNDLKEHRILVFELSREDLWDEKIRKNENFMEITDKNISQFNLEVSQAYSFYELIGDEDKKEIKDFFVN